MITEPSSCGPAASAEGDASQPGLRMLLAAHQAPLLRRSLGQLATTFVPFFALIAAMYAAFDLSPWLSLALCLPAAGLIVRIFIIQHDCGHGAFFRSRAANEWLGRFCSLITLTPYDNWRRQHANHHAMWNNLDRRSSGADIYSTCMTVAEYRALSPLRRWGHRAMHHPLVAQLLLPPLVFLLLYRIPFDTPSGWRHERNSVFLTDLALALLFAALVLLLGAGRVALVPAADHGDCGDPRRVDFFRAAPVRERRVAAPGALDRPCGGAVRQFASAAAAGAAMVQRQYRLSPHPSPDAAGAELPAGGMPPGLRRAGPRHGLAHAPPGPARAVLHAVGRGARTDGAVFRGWVLTVRGAGIRE